MAGVTVEEFTSAILAAAESIGGSAQSLINYGDAGDIDADSVYPTYTGYPSLGSLTELNALDKPTQSIITNRINALVSEVSALFAETFPDAVTDLDDREAVAGNLSAILTGAGMLGTDYENETGLDRMAFDEELKLSVPRQKEQWAARGYELQPGQMKRDLAESYTAKFQALQMRRVQAMGKAMMAPMAQFKTALMQAQSMAVNARAAALSAMSDLIKSAARQGALPGEEYAALVSAKNAAADALIARNRASREFDQQLLKVYLSNLDSEAAVNTYYANMYPHGVGNKIELATARAKVAGFEAQSLWNAINVVTAKNSSDM